MPECNYASEPFDLRLTVLRMIRKSGWIVLFGLLGTLLFGGGYYVKNVLFGEPVRYEVTVTCKMEYTNPPVQTGDYYINDMTWNTYVDSEEFKEMLQSATPFLMLDVNTGNLDLWTDCPGGVAECLSATVASDIHVPSFTISTLSEGKTEILTEAVKEVLVGPFSERIPEIASMQVIDVSKVQAVRPDVRPLRAVILAAVLSFFFVIVIFLLREIGADSIWLPATLRRRYGLCALGTIQSAELESNLRHVFEGKKQVAVCAFDAEAEAVVQSLQQLSLAHQEDKKGNCEWILVEGPLTEAIESLKKADAVLLVVKAGLHAGKPLEYVLEYLTTQEVAVEGALLWDADEWLIRSYYLLPDGRK